MRHFVLLKAYFFFNPIFSICSSIYHLYVLFGHPRSLFPTTSKFTVLLFTIITIPSQNISITSLPLALTGLFKVSSKPGKFVSCWLLFFLFHLTLHIILVIFLKVATLSSINTLYLTFKNIAELDNSVRFLFIFNEIFLP